MRFIHIPLPPNLPKRWVTIYPKRIAKVDEMATHDLRVDYIKRNGSWSLLKKWLAEFSGQKCWYCEAKSSSAPFDVDHFRPKLAITVDGAKLTGHYGYYWLAYEWSNLRLSCQRCNRPEKSESEALHGKGNEFPIQDEAQRCSLPTALLADESPRLLDPCVQADCDLLAHGIDGEVKPLAPHGSWAHLRGRYTIDRLGFNEWNSPETKKKTWRLLDDLIRLVGNHPSVITHLKDHLSSEHEYSRFFRSAIGTHRDKAWVEALL